MWRLRLGRGYCRLHVVTQHGYINNDESGYSNMKTNTNMNMNMNMSMSMVCNASHASLVRMYDYSTK